MVTPPGLSINSPVPASNDDDDVEVQITHARHGKDKVKVFRVVRGDRKRGRER
jgi:hypothetical protein